jgi:hypothetical protein
MMRRVRRGALPLLCPARVLTHGRAIAIDEGHELLGRLGEELKLAVSSGSLSHCSRKVSAPSAKDGPRPQKKKPSVRAASVSAGRPGSATGAES